MNRTTIRPIPHRPLAAAIRGRRPTALALTATALTVLALAPCPAAAQTPPADPAIIHEAAQGLALRGIGPALMGGRIADIAVHPGDPATWYVAVGSGGVWKTTNAGISWTPVFDDQPSYSIGDVAIDPSDPDIVWVGTGENVSGRHVAWGDGVYRSRDGGRSWRRMGLAASEHIGRILIDPRDGNVVFVAAEGPLWSSGGERGLYRTENGGETWEAVLTVDANTGVTDVEFDPVDPDIMYAATYERRRSVWALLAGGPGSGIHKSTDGGRTWRRVGRGLPDADMGKIGLAVSGADRNVVYATIEAAPGDRGFYRSTDRGESWERRNSYISGGTGPHYYQEIEASPHDVDVVYQMDVFVHVTRDGGATFAELGTGREKHSDNHAFWIDPANGRHILAGTDAGLYETFDEGTTWRHFPNMPVSQFYKLALDNSEPFYNILGGAQDLGTLHGPSRTINGEGVRNRDWYVPLGADGYAAAFDPADPAIAFIQTQQGNLQRVNLVNHELINIRPQPAPGDPPERWNWDSPVIASPHAEGRIYYASQRLWRSDDRGNSWQAVSGDLTRNDNRYELPMAGRVRSIDALYGNTAMSLYSTISAISESPVAEGVIFVGTDDGLVQVTEDGGARLEAGGAAAGRVRTCVHERHQGIPTRPRNIFCCAGQPQGGGLHALSLREQRRRPQLAVDRRRPARRDRDLVGGTGPRTSRSAIPRHRTRHLFYDQRGRPLGPAGRRRPHDLVPRPGDPAPRQRPGGRDLRPRLLRPGRLRAAA